MTDFERSEWLAEALQTLQEEALLLDLALLGAQGSVDRLMLGYLLRLVWDVRRHIDEVAAELREITSPAKTVCSKSL